MTNTLKTTLTGSVFALTLTSFIGCGGGSSVTETVTLTGSSITSTVLANATPDAEVSVTKKNRMVNLTPDGGTATQYYLPLGTSVTNGVSSNFYVINKGSTFFTGTVEDYKKAQITVRGTLKTDEGLFDKDFKFANNIALRRGIYDLTIPKLKINDALEVDKFVIKNIVVDVNGASNFIKNITDTSVLPIIGAPLAGGKISLKLDTLGYNKNVLLTINLTKINDTTPGPTYTVPGKTDNNGNVTLDFANLNSTLGSVETITIDLNAS